MWQVSSGLKKDEMRSQAHSHGRGGAANSVFDTSWFTARKLALVPGSRSRPRCVGNSIFCTGKYDQRAKWGGGWLTSSSYFNSYKTYIHSYNIHLYHSISGFLAQEPVWEQLT